MNKKNKERKVFNVNENQMTQCRAAWQQLQPLYQKLGNQLKELGIDPTIDVLKDMVNHNGANAAILLKSMTSKTLKKTGITDPEVLKKLEGNSAVRLLPAKEIAQHIQLIMQNSLLPSFKKAALNIRYLSIEKGNVFVTESTLMNIQNEFFTIFIETKKQAELFNAAEKGLKYINTIMDTVWKYDETLLLDRIFQVGKNDKYELRSSVIEFFGGLPESE